MTARVALLKVHLWLGVISALFLILLGLTGSIIAFENDIDHWLHPSLFYVQVKPTKLTESELVQAVKQSVAPARVVSIHIFREPDLAQVMQLSDRSTVLIDPYNGRILGRRTGPSTTQRIVGYIHQLHTHLVPDPRVARQAAKIGSVIVQIAGFNLCLLVPIGLILWWRAKRFTLRSKGTWFRVCFDWHHTIGVCAAIFLFIAALTGVMVEREDMILWFTKSGGPARFPELHSASAGGAAPISVEQAEEIARRTIPGTSVTDVQLPRGPADVFVVILRVPEETSEAAHSYIFIDQYRGNVLHWVNFLTDSQAYRMIRFNRSIHTGDVWGTPGHIIMAVSSLMLVLMVVTGLVIWSKKLAGP